MANYTYFYTIGFYDKEGNGVDRDMDKEIDEENKWKNEIVKKIAIIQSDMQEIVKEIKKSK